MSKSTILTIENRYLFFFLKYTAHLFFIVFVLLCANVFAQKETKTRNFSIHAGVNSGVLSGGIGPSFSFNYATRTHEVLQFESMLFFDSHSGSTFLSGYSQKNWGAGLAAGLRVNVLPQKNWNPSLFVMGGAMYGSETTSRPNESSGLSGALSFGSSMRLYQKHMVSIGCSIGQNINSLFLKYGILF